MRRTVLSDRVPNRLQRDSIREQSLADKTVRSTSNPLITAGRPIIRFLVNKWGYDAACIIDSVIRRPLGLARCPARTDRINSPKSRFINPTRPVTSPSIAIRSDRSSIESLVFSCGLEVSRTIF